jgi:hypothetical protein
MVGILHLVDADGTPSASSYPLVKLLLAAPVRPRRWLRTRALFVLRYALL